MSREKIASALFGSISVFVLLVGLTKHGPVSPHATLFLLGFCSDGLAVALSPEVLFEHVTLKTLFAGTGSTWYGASAILTVIGTLCLIGAAVFWGVSFVKY